jgi:hypothetical protein
MEANSVNGAPYLDTKKAGQTLMGKKILPSFNTQNATNANKKAAKIYVSAEEANRCSESMSKLPREAHAQRMDH